MKKQREQERGLEKTEFELAVEEQANRYYELQRSLIKAYISMCKMTIEEFCFYVHIDPSTHYRYERRKSKISDRKFVEFLSFFKAYIALNNIAYSEEVLAIKREMAAMDL